MVWGQIVYISTLAARIYIPSIIAWLASHYAFKAPAIAFMAEVIIGFTTVSLVFPLIVIAISINLFVRLCFSLYFRFRYGSKLWLMDGRDSFVSHDEFANSCNHYSLYIIEGHCSLSKIRDKLSWILEQKLPGDGENCEPVYDRMKRRLVNKFGYYCWEHLAKDFDITRHIRYLTDDGSAVFSEQEVFDELKKLYDHPLPNDKSQWEILVIPKYVYNSSSPNQNKSYYGFIVRMHHSIMDGISAGNALQHFIADKPMKLTVDPCSAAHKLPFYKVILAYLQVFILGPRSFLKTLTLDESNCFHGPRLTGPKTLAWSRQVNVDALRKIKDATKTSVTAVLVSCLGGSVRNLAERKGLHIPTKVHAFPTIGMLPFKDIKPRNQFVMALLPLAVGLDTSLERLRSAYRSFKDLLNSPDILVNYHLMDIIGMFPVTVINFFIDMCHATMLLSNVPGPAERAKVFGGDEVVDIGIWAPIQLAMGIGMSLFSYGGIVRATIVADKTACPDHTDVPTLIQEFEKEIVVLARQSNVPEQEVFL